jgi:hypothetical protein
MVEKIECRQNGFPELGSRSAFIGRSALMQAGSLNSSLAKLNNPLVNNRAVSHSKLRATNYSA